MPPASRQPRRQARPVRRPASRQGGIALVLVVIAVAVALILGVSFLSSQNTLLTISKNIRAHPRARHIAESGLELALQHVQSDEDWRSRHSNGAWTTDHPLAGGTFTIVGEDGRDTNGDGTIDSTEGDGDLADDPGDPLTLTATGRFDGASHTVRAVVHYQGTGVYGAAVRNAVSIDNGSVVDSFNSADGRYSSFNAGDNAHIATNATATGAISLRNHARIEGNLYYGVGGTDAVLDDRQGTVTGSVGPLPEPLRFPAPPDWPDNVGPNLGDRSLNGGMDVINTNQQYGDLTLRNGATVYVLGERTLRINGDLTVRNRAALELLPGATLTLYVGGTIRLENQASLNVNTAQPQRLIIFGRGANLEHELSNRAEAYAVFDTPDADLDIDNRAQLYGGVICRALTVRNHNSGLHLDHNPNLLGIHDRFRTSSSGGRAGGLAVSWVEMP